MAGLSTQFGAKQGSGIPCARCGEELHRDKISDHLDKHVQSVYTGKHERIDSPDAGYGLGMR